MTIHMHLLEKQLSDQYISAILSWEKEHPGTKYSATPRPLVKATVTGPQGQVVTLGTFRTRAVVLSAVEPYLRRAASIVFTVTMPTEEDGL
jgi:hypothetical protein